MAKRKNNSGMMTIAEYERITGRKYEPAEKMTLDEYKLLYKMALKLSFDAENFISKCQTKAKRYPTIKKWFLVKYPAIAKFGMAAEDEETNNQNVIPMPEVQAEIQPELKRA